MPEQQAVHSRFSARAERLLPVLLPDVLPVSPPRRPVAIRPPVVLSGALALAALLAGCSAPLPYVPRDAGLAQARIDYRSRDLRDEALGQFLAAAGHPLPAAGQPWDFETLALVAGWYSADVWAAQVRWQVALDRQALGPVSTPTVVDGQLEHHSLTDASRPQPWTLGLGFEFTLPSARRRAARQAQLDAAVQLARIELAQTFWNARREVRGAWEQLLAVQAQVPLTLREQALGRERAERVQARVRAGEAAAAELLAARQAAGQAELAVDLLERQRQAAQRALRAALGLPSSGPDIGLVAPETAGMPVPTDAEAAALENRLDLRAAEARFEAADADLRWEVAQQYPEIGLRPGYEWDQGDHRLRIGLSLPLPLPVAHRAQVTQAEAEREARARELQGRQVRVLQQLDAAREAVQEAAVAEQGSVAGVSRAEAQLRAAEAAQHAGETDPLAVLDAEQALLAARSLRVQSGQALMRRRAELEDVVQQPLALLEAHAGSAAGARTARKEPAP